MLFPLLTLWTIYFILHSVLASLSVKRWFSQQFPVAMVYYRLGFNLFSFALLLPLLAWTLWLGQQQPLLLHWQGGWYWFAKSLNLTAFILFLSTLLYYDLSHFLGIKQYQQGSSPIDDNACFSLSPLHRWVRHPWYSLGLIMLWTHNMDIHLLSVALLTHVYLIIGLYFEEQKLHHQFGKTYLRYTLAVPALIPRPWRYLSRVQATQLINTEINSNEN